MPPARFQTFRRVYLTLDNDEAGCRAAAHLGAELNSRCVVVDLPPGVHDLNDLERLPGGREAFLSFLEDPRAMKSFARTLRVASTTVRDEDPGEGDPS
ncbi:hypothetical protein HRbin29_01759 [bacterium HR29]|jgi:DNA primase|nr:hypothetical protein HRbin29_01759 [bacterium HR29]